MKKPKFSVVKLFDCQDMPDETTDEFFEHYRNGNPVGNDCVVEWCIRDYSNSAVSQWLIKNGAQLNENVLIKHWW